MHSRCRGKEGEGDSNHICSNVQEGGRENNLATNISETVLKRVVRVRE